MYKFNAILIIIFINQLIGISIFAQSPEKISYQVVVRNSSNALVTNTQIGMEINIRQGSISGIVVYTETQTPTTNANGLVSTEIGSGAGFNTIDWSAGPFFIETKMAVSAPLTTYTITGTSQLLAVPYALHAKTAETIKGGITETDPVFIAWDKSTGISITENQISDFGNYIEMETDPSVPAGTQAGEMQYWNGTAWVTVATTENEGATLQMIGGIPTWTGGTPIVTNPNTGKIWMDRNLGALQVATSSTDAGSYGDLYQWGRAADGHESRASGTRSTLSTSDIPGHGDFITNNNIPNDWRSPQNENLWQGVSGTNNPCPNGYRLPTEAEWQAERQTWNSNNSSGAFASPLKLPLPGRRLFSNGSIGLVNSGGLYWSSTIEGTESRGLFFFNSNAYMLSSVRAFGYSVRCLKN